MKDRRHATPMYRSDEMQSLAYFAAGCGLMVGIIGGVLLAVFFYGVTA